MLKQPSGAKRVQRALALAEKSHRAGGGNSSLKFKK